MNRKGSQVSEFLTNPEFVRWVQHPDRELEVYWLKWMEANPGCREELKLAREITQGFHFKHKLPGSATKQDVLANILNSGSNIYKLGENSLSPIKQNTSSFWNRFGQGSKVAAILVLAFVFSFMVDHLQNEPAPLEPVAVVNTIHKATAYGEKLHLKLPDGTQVWLNSGSELQYPEQFDSLERIVHLKGEVFFEVEKGENWPFSVITNDLVTTALGTSFNINNEGTDILSISLVSGKVKVKNDLTRENILLLPGQQLQYSEESRKTVVGSFEESQAIGWKSGLLQFTQASFEEVCEELEKWYGVKINVTGSPSRKWNLSGEYPDQNLAMVLKRISYIEQFGFSVKEKNVHIDF
jgi:ferric-dicitrate binding protein FerR (iron transport regulator)